MLEQEKVIMLLPPVSVGIVSILSYVKPTIRYISDRLSKENKKR
jgi:hypothetical protein